MSGLHAGATSTLSSWQATTPEQESMRQAFLAFLAARPDACARECAPGHLTASAVVLDHACEHVLLTLHPRVGRWLQLGGHCEPGDDSLAAAALREAREESGITDLGISMDPVHLDVHPVTCSLGVPTRHLDVRFVIRAPAEAHPARSPESLALEWWPLHALPPGAEELRPLIDTALRC